MTLQLSVGNWIAFYSAAGSAMPLLPMLAEALRQWHSAREALTLMRGIHALHPERFKNMTQLQTGAAIALEDLSFTYFLLLSTTFTYFLLLCRVMQLQAVRCVRRVHVSGARARESLLPLMSCRRVRSHRRLAASSEASPTCGAFTPWQQRTHALDVSAYFTPATLIARSE
jgi:hypothetical protein